MNDSIPAINFINKFKETASVPNKKAVAVIVPLVKMRKWKKILPHQSVIAVND